MQRLVFGGCHLTRPITDLITSAGFTITRLDTFYVQGPPRFTAATSRRVARSD